MLNTYEQRSRLKLATTVISVLVVAGIVLVADHLKSSAKASGLTTVAAVRPTSSTSSGASTQSSQSTQSSGSTSSSSSSTSSSGYKDGTYNASSSYYVPPGNERIQVSLTLKNGVITSSSVQNSEGDPVSASFQQGFAASYKTYVVGQKLSSLQLGVIAGASDTTQGFVDALNQIASQAQA